MAEPLEDLYFRWLYAKVCNSKETDASQRYERLLEILYCTRFEWTVCGDDNRAEDGLDLWDEFLTFTGINGPLKGPEDCSIFEMLVAFSRKASYETELSSKSWFWIMVDNLGLAGLSDDLEIDRNQVEGILDIFVWRMYDDLGHGGILPLRESEYDQRFIEIWYQFSEYCYQNNIT